MARVLYGQGLVSCLGVWPGSSQWFSGSVVRAVWLGSSELLGWFRLCGRAWMVQAVWPGSSELLGWFRLCGQGLVSGSGCVAGSSELLGWFRLCGQGLVSCVCLVSILHVLYRMEMK